MSYASAHGRASCDRDARQRTRCVVGWVEIKRRQGIRNKAVFAGSRAEKCANFELNLFSLVWLYSTRLLRGVKLFYTHLPAHWGMSKGCNSVTYAPLDMLKPVAKDVWIVDGPMIRFGMAPLKMQFPTRMTVIRSKRRALFIHSPTPLTDSLKAEIANIGEVRHIVGPNRIHYWWIPEWRTAFPKAEVWLAPRIREQAKGRIDFDAPELTKETGYPWDEEIKTLPVAGSFMTEVEFFHPASRTLVLTDFIENFEPKKLSWWWRWLARAGGVLAPNGGMPRDMRLTYSRQKPQLKAAVETMIGWNPERIILAHGKWIERDGAAELKRSFGWLLD